MAKKSAPKVKTVKSKKTEPIIEKTLIISVRMQGESHQLSVERSENLDGLTALATLALGQKDILKQMMS